jgi:hypothetical protein
MSIEYTDMGDETTSKRKAEETEEVEVSKLPKLDSTEREETANEITIDTTALFLICEKNLEETYPVHIKRLISQLSREFNRYDLGGRGVSLFFFFFCDSSTSLI